MCVDWRESAEDAPGGGDDGLAGERGTLRAHANHPRSRSGGFVAPGTGTRGRARADGGGGEGGGHGGHRDRRCWSLGVVSCVVANGSEQPGLSMTRRAAVQFLSTFRSTQATSVQRAAGHGL